MLFRTFLIAVGFTLAVPAAAQLATQADMETQRTPIEMRSAQIVDLLNGELAPELGTVFSEEFLAAVPPAQLAGLSAQITGSFGRALSVESLDPRDGTQAALEVRLERATAVGVIVIDPARDNRIVGLRFTSFEPIDDTPEKIKADLRALPGQVNAYFAPLEGGTPVISIGADTPLALGSTVKLYVLAALGEDIAAGKRTWSDVVPLTQKSFPSGQMQDWPGGSPATLHTLASLMVSISDNTATDQLIDLLGRERVIELMKDTGHSAPELNNPLMTTLDLFELKAAGPDLIEQWRNGDRAARISILKRLGDNETASDTVQAAFSGRPNAIDIEWFATPRDLSRLFAHMRRKAHRGVFPIMAINPGVPAGTKANWQYVGYKGGSEPGVLNLTWLLTDSTGRDWVLTLGWNNPETVVDQTKLELIAQRILSLPRE